MNVDAFLICEYATITDEGTSLSVLKTFNALKASSFPATVPGMCLAMVVHAHASEAGTSHELEVVVLNEKREKIAELEKATFKLAGDPEAPDPSPGLPIRHYVVHRILLPTFETAGVYAFEAYIDGTYAGGQVFAIKQA